MNIAARHVRPNDRLVKNGQVERVVRVHHGPRGYVHIRTVRCDRVVPVDKPIEIERPS